MDFILFFFFFFQAEDGIRDVVVTGVQTCALPISLLRGGMVIGLTSAPSGNVWVSQNAGLVEIDAEHLRIVSRVSKEDGLIDDEAWAYGPLTAAPDGRLYFATPS